MTILIFFFFFQFQGKKKIGFYKLFLCFFSISILFYSPHSHPDFLHSHPDSLHSYLDSPHSHPIPHIPHIPTHIPYIPTLIPCIPNMIPHIPTLIPCIPIIPLIPFLNYPFWLLQIAMHPLFPALKIDFLEKSAPNNQSAWKMFQIEVKWLAGIKVSCMKLSSGVNQHPGPIIRDFRVSYMFSYILPVIFLNFWQN